MSTDRELAISFPLDSDRFLRRECPTCEREFKWFSAEEGEADASPVPEGGYYCPYCAIQAPPDQWWTQAQAAVINSMLTKEIIEPELKKLERSMRDLSRQSGGLIEAKTTTDLPPEADPLVETDDMRRVDFACHPDEPVKVLDDWTRDVHCLLCGSTAEPKPGL